MKLWLIKARPEFAEHHDLGEIDYSPWFNPWDKYFGFVIRAESAEQARLYAANNSADEGRECWLDPTYTSCELLEEHGDIGVVLSDFNAG